MKKLFRTSKAELSDTPQQQRPRANHDNPKRRGDITPFPTNVGRPLDPTANPAPSQLPPLSAPGRPPPKLRPIDPSAQASGLQRPPPAEIYMHMTDDTQMAPYRREPADGRSLHATGSFDSVRNTPAGAAAVPPGGIGSAPVNGVGNVMGPPSLHTRMPDQGAPDLPYPPFHQQGVHVQQNSSPTSLSLPPGAAPPSPQLGAIDAPSQVPSRMSHVPQASIGSAHGSIVLSSHGYSISNVEPMQPPQQPQQQQPMYGAPVATWDGQEDDLPTPVIDRGRSFSIASQSRGSDHEVSVTHNLPQQAPAMAPPKHTTPLAPQPMIAAHAPSPLANSFSELPPGQHYNSWSAAGRPLPGQPQLNVPQSQLPQSGPLPPNTNQIPQPALGGQLQQLSHSQLPPSAPHSMRATPTIDESQVQPRDMHRQQQPSESGRDKERKEKRSFWGWGDRKHKDKDKDKHKSKQGIAMVAPPMAATNAALVEPPHRGISASPSPPSAVMEDMHRPSFSDWTNADLASVNDHDSSAQHHSQEDPTGFYALTSSLCANPATNHTQIHELCRAIDKSPTRDQTCKDVTAALRDAILQGPDQSRRQAARIWHLAFRNCHAQAYRAYASDATFVAALEHVLLRQREPNEDKMNEKTLNTLTDILSSNTYHYTTSDSDPMRQVWQKVRRTDPSLMENQPENGLPLPKDQFLHAYRSRNPQKAPLPPPKTDGRGSRLSVASKPPPANGPGYADLVNPREDIRRLNTECMAAIEATRVLNEALVYNEDINRGVITNFHTKCKQAYQSLGEQKGWAQAEASRARAAAEQNGTMGDIPEEIALGKLYEALRALDEVLTVYDDRWRMADEERQLREVQERSKKETRMDTRQQMDMLTVANSGAGASTSRTPSPPLHVALPSEGEGGQVGWPDYRSDRAAAAAITAPESYSSHRLAPGTYEDVRLPSSSPDNRHPLPQPPKISTPPRTSSPVGRARIPGPRPLPPPNNGHRFQNVLNQSSQSLSSDAAHATGGGALAVTALAAGHPAPSSHSHSHSHSGSTHHPPGGNRSSSPESDGEGVIYSQKMSDKMRGKQPARPIDPDNDFDPNDLQGGGYKPKPVDSASVHSIDLLNMEEVHYAYDAYQEKIDREAAEAALARSKAGTPGVQGARLSPTIGVGPRAAMAAPVSAR